MRFCKLPIRENLSEVGSDSFSGRLLTCLKAALVGLLTPLCSCGALPIAIALHEEGASLPAVVSFLTASQGAGIDSAFITMGLLGRVAALYRLMGAVVLAVAAGLASSRGAGEKKKKKSKKMNGDSSSSSSSSFISGLSEIKLTEAVGSFISHAASDLGEVLPTIVLGIGFTVAFTSYGPSLNDIYSKWDGGGGRGEGEGMNMELLKGSVLAFLTRAILLSVALPLQLCEHATVAVASGLLRRGASAGLSFAFLISAPATNLASLAILVRSSSSSNGGGGGGGGGKGKDETTTLREGVLAVMGVALALVASALAMSFLVDIGGLSVGLEEGGAGGGHDHSHGLSIPGWNRFVQLSPSLTSALLAIHLVRRVGKWLRNGKTHVH